MPPTRRAEAQQAVSWQEVGEKVEEEQHCEEEEHMSEGQTEKGNG